MSEVVLAGRCPWWAESAQRARWDGRDVVAWVGPETADPAAFDRYRARAAAWVGRTGPLVPLLAFTRLDRRPVWLYEPPTGVSTAVLVREERDGLPGRVALELCARVADALLSLGDDARTHPGPELHHVLVATDGQVALSHGAGPGPRSPACREPRGREDDGAVVWRLGVLLSALLTGQPPQPATDPSSHESAERRLAIRLLARPGPPLPAETRDFLTALLAWEPLDRPALLRVGPRLRELASALAEPGLSAWARERVPIVRVLGPAAPAAPTAEPGPLDVGEEHTQEVVLAAELVDDDDTALSADGDTSGQHRAITEPGAIPVGVGPPAELMRRLRATPAPPEPSGTVTTPDPPSQPPRYGPLLAATAVGLLLAGALVGWLLWR